MKACYHFVGNLYQLLLLLAEDHVGMKTWLQQRDGLLLPFYSLKLAYLVYSAPERFSTNLQVVSITVHGASSGAQLLSQYLKSLQTEENFEIFYDHVLKESSSLVLPQPRKLQRRFNDGGSAHQYPGPKDKYWHVSFEAPN